MFLKHVTNAIGRAPSCLVVEKAAVDLPRFLSACETTRDRGSAESAAASARHKSGRAPVIRDGGPPRGARRGTPAAAPAPRGSLLGIGSADTETRLSANA